MTELSDMQIEAGKRYTMRNGDVSGVLRPNKGDWLAAYVLQDNDTAWTADGYILRGFTNEPRDLVAEYVPENVAYPDETFDDNRRDAIDSVALAAVSDGDAYDIAALDALAEVRRAKELWPNPANSMHEQFAVLDEEIDELLDASGFTLVQILHGRGKLWNHVKVNQKRRDLAAARKEAIQVAAMALRFAAECCDETVGRR